MELGRRLKTVIGSKNLSMVLHDQAYRMMGWDKIDLGFLFNYDDISKIQ